MNSKQKQLLGLGAAVMVAMIIFPPWIKTTHRVVMATDRNRTIMQTDTQEFAGYSPLFDPPKIRKLDSPQFLIPGDYYESVEIDFGKLFLQWIIVAVLTTAGTVYFKGSNKKSLQELWAGSYAAEKTKPATAPPKLTVQSVEQMSELEKPATIILLCNKCGQKLRAKATKTAVVLKCPSCQNVFNYHPATSTACQNEQPVQTQSSTDVRPKTGSETTPENQLSPWKRAANAFNIGFIAGIASAYSAFNKTQPDISPFARMLVAGIAGVFIGLVSYLIGVAYYSVKKNQ